MQNCLIKINYMRPLFDYFRLDVPQYQHITKDKDISRSTHLNFELK